MKRPLNPIDEVFLSMGREPGLTHGQFLRFRGSPPPLAELRDHLVARLPGLPRLTYRTTTTSGRAYQVPSACFDIRDHLREEEFPAGTTLDEVLTALARLPLPRGGGPMWSLHLVHGYAPKEYAVCYRVHHSTEDGMGAVHVVGSLFGDGTEPERTGRDDQGPLFGACPDELVRGTLSVGAGLVRGLLPVRRWPKAPEPRPGHLAVCSTTATQRELGLLGQRFGGTFNDAFLMALWGALATWSATGEKGGVRSVFRASPVPVRMPLSTRRTGEEAAPGNHLTTAVVALPGQGLRTDAAFAELVDGTHRMRSRGLRPASRALVALLPAALTRWTVRRLLSPRSSPLYASNYRQPKFLSFKGDPVIDAIPLGVLLPGNALSVTLLSCGSRVRVSFLYDRRLPGADRLAALWREALDTLSAPSGPTAAATAPLTGTSTPSTHTKGPSC
ncbi:wax ester/triacylglycerol synthase domain-containing protein [Streptomyces sp. NPDC020667]|uniref:wax ester/triacylglycerol synthase domain-containing protein n=1 Tax=Streptomyces sp. NPDC020667 TaxID=3154895 RepID=UPI0033F9098E